jgi:membrane protein YdbS with pleckstrin-like domain
MQQIPPRFSLFRALLFPYSGEEPLTPAQTRRIVVLWALVFTFPMVLCTLLVTVFAATPLYKAALLLLIVLLAGLIIFGLSAWALVGAVNRTARFRQAQRYKDQ